MSKFIITKWAKPEGRSGSFLYDLEQRIIESTHPEYTKGRRFDFGFLSLASKQGYIITVLPPDIEVLNK